MVLRKYYTYQAYRNIIEIGTEIEPVQLGSLRFSKKTAWYLSKMKIIIAQIRNLFGNYFMNILI